MKNKFDLNEFIDQGNLFITATLNQLSLLGFTVNDLLIDHVCFRVETLDEYLYYKSELLTHGKLLSQAQINGRAISTILLNNGFSYQNKKINIIELPSPKELSSYKTGFEHIECVISDSFSAFQPKYPQLQLSRSGPKNFNAELVLKTASGQVKFHHIKLDRVIEIEESKFTDIIFDFDGTLIESRDKIYDLNSRVFSKALSREVTMAEAKDKFHSTFEKLFEAFLIIDPIVKKKTADDWQSESKKIEYELLPNIFKMLTTLKDLGYRLHLWTARDEESGRVTLDQHQLTSFFTTLSFATIHSSKPAVENLRFDWFRAMPNSVIVVGDTASDVQGAKNIKAVAVGAIWEREDHEASLRKAGVEVCFSDPNEFLIWLQHRHT
ncbi:MAG: VOC family protein [Bdellovibrio sp.]|nr:VOC family protein [Bdellovibrio sp.]